MVSGTVRFVLLAILAGGGLLVAYGLLSLLQFLRLWLLDRRGGGGLSPGARSLRGVAEPERVDDHVQSPATGVEVLLYEYTVQRRDDAPATPSWRSVAGRQGGVPFMLSVDGGSALVDPAGAALDLAVDVEVAFTADPDELEADGGSHEALDLEHDEETVVLGDRPLDVGERYRVVERRIEPGDEVAVTGVARRVDADGNGGRSRGDSPAVAFRGDRGWLRDLVGVPYVVGDADGGAATRLRNRVAVGLLFGLPLVMLSLVYLFPPGG